MQKNLWKNIFLRILWRILCDYSFWYDIYIYIYIISATDNNMQKYVTKLKLPSNPKKYINSVKEIKVIGIASPNRFLVKSIMPKFNILSIKKTKILFIIFLYLIITISSRRIRAYLFLIFCLIVQNLLFQKSVKCHH